MAPLPPLLPRSPSQQTNQANQGMTAEGIVSIVFGILMLLLTLLGLHYARRSIRKEPTTIGVYQASWPMPFRSQLGPSRIPISRYEEHTARPYLPLPPARVHVHPHMADIEAVMPPHRINTIESEPGVPAAPRPTVTKLH